MKIGVKNRDIFGNKNGDKAFTNLIIENLADSDKYYEILAPKVAQEHSDIFFGFNSQSYRTSISDYIIHEGLSSAETKLLCFKLSQKDTDTDMIEFSQMSDNIINEKCNNIKKYVEKGYTVAINSVGGYSFVEDISMYDELIEPTDEQIKTFIYKGSLQKPSLEITKRTVIIENDKEISTTLKNKLPSEIQEYDELVDFKRNISLFTDEEIVTAFVKAVKNGMENIVFETTGQDLQQIIKMNLLLNKVKDITKVNISLYILSYNEKVYEQFSGFNMIKL